MRAESEERRPAAEPDGDRNLIVGDDSGHDTSTPLQVRRRRRASYRCPQMTDGRQDTLDGSRPRDQEPSGVQDRKADVVAEVGRRTVWWSTDSKNVWLIYAACESVGSKRMRDPLIGLLCSPITHASDVIACLEYRHHLNVQVIEVNR